MTAGCIAASHDSVLYEEMDESPEIGSSPKYYSAPSLDRVSAILLDTNMMEWDPR